jgi:uncharacterized protein (TIGR03437 family)
MLPSRKTLTAPGTWIVAGLLGAGLWQFFQGPLNFRAAAQTPALPARYPYLQNMRPDGVTIVWTTPDTAVGTVRYSANQNLSSTVTATVEEIPSSVTGLGISYYRYQAELTGLSPGTQYFYQVLMDGQNLTPANDLRFRTAGAGPFMFLAFGDSGTGSPEQAQLAQLMFQENPALVLHVGDIAYPDGTFGQFLSNYLSVYSPLMRRAPFFPVPGNHDYFTKFAAPYLSLHAPPTQEVPAADRGRYYSFDWDNVHFVALDTNTPFLNATRGNGGMLDWLDNDLKKTRRLWRVVYFHHPVNPTSGEHEDDETSALVRQYIEPILDRNGVQLVLSGHDHNYQRDEPRRGGLFVEPGAGTVNIITGGGGAPLYTVTPHIGVADAETAFHYLRGEVQGPSLTLRAFRIDGVNIDGITLSALPVVSRESVVNAASFTTALAPGALVSIFGRELATGQAQASTLPLPMELSGTSLTINGRSLPVLYVSHTQINAQLPFDVQGAATLRITTPGGSTDVPVVISEPAPAIFSTTPDLGRSPAVTHANGALISPSAPAQPGETVSIYLTGLGRPNGEITAGQAAPFVPLLTARGPVEAQVGGVSAPAAFAGLAPGFAGLYQVNVQVPRQLPTGTYGLRIVDQGVSSNLVDLAVKQ